MTPDVGARHSGKLGGVTSLQPDGLAGHSGKLGGVSSLQPDGGQGTVVNSEGSPHCNLMDAETLPQLLASDY